MAHFVNVGNSIYFIIILFHFLPYLLNLYNIKTDIDPFDPKDLMNDDLKCYNNNNGNDDSLEQSEEMYLPIYIVICWNIYQ